MPPAENDASFRNHAGTVLWPTSPTALTDTTICPACFTQLRAVVCHKCGLNLAHPAANELANLSHAAADALSQRVEVIGRIRYETSQSPLTAAVTPTQAAAISQDATVAQDAAGTAPAEPSLAYPAPAASTQPATPEVNTRPVPSEPRRSGVQVALLIAGVSLLSVFAIFFLVYVFINYGIVWRSVIIAAITVAAFVSASLLRRKSLIASAEGLAVFALVLVYLDAYALRANDFFWLGTADGAVYWGATISIASVFFIAWHRLSKVRAASIVGWAGITVGIGVLVWGLADGTEPATRAFAAISATAVSGLANVLVPRPSFRGTLERMLVLSTTAFALFAAFLVSWFVDPPTDWGGAVACAIVALMAFAHASAATLGQNSTPATRAFGKAFAAGGGAAAALAASVAAVRVAVDDTAFAVFMPVVAAAAVALALQAAAGRGSGLPLRLPSVFAAWGATAVLALTGLVPLTTAAAPIGVGLASATSSPWRGDATSSLALSQAHGDLAVLALASVVGLAAAFWVLTGSLRRYGAVLAWAVGVLLILAAAQLPSVWLTLAGWLVLLGIAFALLLRARRTTMPLAYRACLVSVLAAASTLIFLIGWTSLDTWAATTAATIAVVLASRLLTSTAETRATLLGTATVLLFVAVTATARHLTWGSSVAWEVELANVLILLALSAAVVVAASAIGYRRVVTARDRRTMFWIAGPVAGASAFALNSAVAAGVGSDASIMLPQPATSLVASAMLFGGFLLWVGLRRNAALRPERIAASIALAPVVLWVVDSFARVLGLSEFAQSVVPITAALLAAAGALAVTLLRPTGTPRWAREVGVAIVGVPAVVTAVSVDAASGWLVLLLAGVSVLLIAVGPDGLFSSSSLRRHLGWAALALATAGLWWRLSSDRIEALEPYVLPLAAALLVIAYLIHRAAQRAETPSKAAPIVALSGLLVAILPLAANSLTGDATRAIVVFGVSAVLLLVGSVLVHRHTQPYLDAMALSGAVGVLITAVGRAFLAPSHNLVPDGWMVAVVAVLVIAAFGQARQRNDESSRPRQLVSQALVTIGIISVAAIEAAGFSDATLGTVRAIATVTLLGALHVIAFTIDSVPLTRTVAAAAIAFAAGSAAVGVVAGALDPIELGSIPIAIALLVTGRIRLGTEPDARSWPSLAPGLGVLLAPSLMMSFTEPELWRLVALGAVAVAVLIVGAVRRLQAPFVLGLVVALIHGFATFAPQIRAVYESQEWWLWAGLAGVVLVLLAIRYERRIQNLKDAVGKIAELR